MLQEEVVENASAKRCRDVIVCGFYTPDYAEIAANLAKSLDLHSIPYKLYPVEKFGKAWIAQPLRKPEIILRCMEEFPHRVVIFMDADCTVHADISPLIEEVVDVGVYFFKTPRGPKKGQIFPSSRVVVCRPTERTKLFLENWRGKCQETIQKLLAVDGSERKLWSRGLTEDNDEKLLLDAMAETSHLNIHILPASFSAYEEGEDCIVSHKSARDKLAPPEKGPSIFKQFRRRIVELAVGKPYAEWKNEKLRK